jgi:hypothetical protein
MDGGVFNSYSSCFVSPQLLLLIIIIIIIIRRRRRRRNQYIQNKLFKENTKQFYRYLGAKTIAMKEQPHIEEVESYWKSLWEEKVKHNEEAE